jgi:mannose-6-phosphate isomerase
MNNIDNNCLLKNNENCAEMQKNIIEFYKNLIFEILKKKVVKIIKDNREILLSEEINGQLSYLFKILSINKPLSIQLHPEKTFAEILHRKFPKIYKDDNHKPELFIALSDFELLFGFVEMNKAIETIIKYKNCFNLKEGEKLLEEPNIENYKLFIEKLIFLEKDEYEKIIKLIIENEETKNDYLLKKLYDNYGLDPGILIALFMNHLHKKRGEAVFIDENIPHSYIFGNCLELMSCSDNVIRLGLTPKLVDKQNFEKIVNLNFEDMIYDKSNKNESDFMEVDKENGIIKYDIKYIDDFKMEIYDIKEGRFINIEKNSILFCLEGSMKINGILCEEFNSFFVKNPINYARIELNEGCNSSKLYKVYKR